MPPSLLMEALDSVFQLVADLGVSPVVAGGLAVRSVDRLGGYRSASGTAPGPIGFRLYASEVSGNRTEPS